MDTSLNKLKELYGPQNGEVIILRLVSLLLVILVFFLDKRKYIGNILEFIRLKLHLQQLKKLKDKSGIQKMSIFLWKFLCSIVFEIVIITV